MILDRRRKRPIWGPPSRPGARSRQRSLAAAGIVLYAVIMGDAATPLDLSELARPCGGLVFPAANPEAAPATIFDHIDHMQPVKLHSVAPQHVDMFGPLVIAGLAVSSLYGGSLWGMRYTPW